ncbi:MAG: polysaccharide biosynthesis tyrosine autokinase [Leptolyngbya sp. SIO1D8]|nr:polysaccharide biosynthesis tyrosine autokinase [Leptolyngbya sp. SIO1D8]
MTSELQSPPANMLAPAPAQEGGLKLGRFASALKRNILLIAGITTLTASAAVFKAITDTPTYESSLELLTPPITLETQIISTLNPEALSNQSEVVNVAIDETKLKILKSPRVMEPIVVRLQERYLDIDYGEVVGSLDIYPTSTGDTLTVQYKGVDAEKVLYVLEVVAEFYLKFSLEDRQNDIFRGIDFVDEQLPIVRDRVEQLEAELEGLRQRSNLIDPLQQGEQLSQKAAEFTAEQLNLRVQIQEAEQLSQNLQRELLEGEESAVTSALLESERYQNLLNQMLELDGQLAEELTLYLEDSPEIEVIREQRENLQPLLQREGIRVQDQLANFTRELQVRDQALTRAITTLNQQIKDLSTTTRTYNNIQRELEIATANLNQFLTKREALRIDAAQRQTPWEILTPPKQPRASSASAKRNLVMGTVLGILLGSGVAILVDRVRGKIHTIDELKEVSQLPLLGTIPYEKLLENEQSLALSISQLSQMGFAMNLFPSQQEPSDSHKPTFTPFLESFRILATNIELSNPDDPVRTLAITSAIPNMGKSTVTFHLAHAIAATGKRVLMMDTDLRRPTLHKLCNASNDKGLSNYVTGEFNPEDILIDLPLEPGLFLLPSGPIPPDPMKILTAQRIRNLFDYLDREFDFIIFDTPPLLGFADAFIIAANTKGVLLTATLGQITFSQLQSALDELDIAKIPVLGAVANGSQPENVKSYNYYQYYQQSVSAEKNGNSKNPSDTQDDESAWYTTPLSWLKKSSGNKR